MESEMKMLFPSLLNDVVIVPPPEPLPIVDQVRAAEWGCGCGIGKFGEEIKKELTYFLNTHPGIYEKLLLEKEKFRVRFVRDFSCTVSLTMQFIGAIRKELVQRVKSLIAIYQSFIHCITNIANCFQRPHQLLAIGVDTTHDCGLKALFESANIAGLKRKILNSTAEIATIVQDAISAYNTAQDAMLSNHMADPGCNPEDYQRIDFAIYKSEIDKLKLSIHEKFSLHVTHQPEPVIQTKIKTRSMKVRLLNFNNVAVESVQLTVFLIAESTTKKIVEADAGTLPETPTLAGKLTLGGESVLIEEEVEEVLKAGVKRLRKDAIPPSSSSDADGTSFKLEFKSTSANPKHWDIEIPFKIVEIVRKNKVKVKVGENESSQLVAKEKYCFLFVSKLPTEMGKEDVKVWTTSLPFIVTTYSGHREIASGVMAWDNAFPLPGRTDFTVRQKGNLNQFTEMLEGFFKLNVGRVLKPSHVRCLKEKLEKINGPATPDIRWTEIMRDDRGPSFWCWFYRTTLILNRYLKSLWDAGYFKAFISFETAAKLLIDNNTVPTLFLLRFSDNVAGAVSIVFVLNNKSIDRLGPFEFYKDRSIAKYSLELLRNLNGKYLGKGGDVLRWVLTEENTRAEKKTAFEEFYKYAEENELQINPTVRYYRMIPALEPSTARNTTTDTEQSSSKPNPIVNEKDLTAFFDNTITAPFGTNAAHTPDTRSVNVENDGIPPELVNWVMELDDGLL